MLLGSSSFGYISGHMHCKSTAKRRAIHNDAGYPTGRAMMPPVELDRTFTGVSIAYGGQVLVLRPGGSILEKMPMELCIARSMGWCMKTGEALIASTQKLLWTRGYTGMSPRAILDHSSVGQGSLYHHFEGNGRPDPNRDRAHG